MLDIIDSARPGINGSGDCGLRVVDRKARPSRERIRGALRTVDTVPDEAMDSALGVVDHLSIWKRSTVLHLCCIDGLICARQRAIDVVLRAINLGVRVDGLVLAIANCRTGAVADELGDIVVTIVQWPSAICDGHLLRAHVSSPMLVGPRVPSVR